MLSDQTVCNTQIKTKFVVELKHLLEEFGEVHDVDLVVCETIKLVREIEKCMPYYKQIN